MRLIIVSGLSGSGKSVALNTLEDSGFYSIDNLPPGLLIPLIDSLRGNKIKLYDEVAVGIDARSDSENLKLLPHQLETLRKQGVDVEIMFLETAINTLIRRFSETRRKHPLSRTGMPLMEAIEIEKAVLSEITAAADLRIDTTQTSIHDLRKMIKERLRSDSSSMSLLFQSFGFKHGTPGDTDFMFDVRCLPNPHWDTRLRGLTGRDPEVIEYLENFKDVIQMFEMIRDFLEQWLPRFQQENRSYITVSIGCTGGQHRSVYLAERLYRHFKALRDTVSLRHRDSSD